MEPAAPARTGTLHDLAARLPALGRRRAVGVSGELGVRWWTYARLHDEALAAAAFLACRGVGKGDLVALWAPNGPEWTAAFLGIALRGAVALLVDADTPAPAVWELASREGAVLVFHRADADPPAGARSVAASVTAPQRPCASVPRDVVIPVGPEDPLAVLHTSGTTSEARGVLLAHGNVMAQVQTFGGWRRVTARVPLRMLSLPPSSHVLGLVVGLAIPLWLGLGVLYASADRPVAWARLVRDQRIFAALAVPRVLQALEQHVRAARVGRSGRSLDERLRSAGPVARYVATVWARGAVLGRPLFRLFLVGGAHLPPATRRFWQRAGVLVVEGYGLAETGAFVTVGHALARGGGVGRAVGGQRVALAADGEILVHGPNVAAGYRTGGRVLEMPTEAGFLATGDIGRLDGRGRLHVIGRKKDVLVTAEGESVHPSEAEAVMAAVPGVRDACVTAVDGGVGEELHAVLRLGAGADAAAVVRAANALLPERLRLRGWTVWPADEELPRNRMGKVLRADVVSRLAALRDEAAPRGAVEDPASEPDRARRVVLLARLLARPDPPGGLASARLADLGLGSLDVVELAARVEALSGAPVAGAFLSADASVGSVHAALHGRGGPRARAVPLRPPFATLPFRLARPLVRPLATALWRGLNADVDACWHADPRAVERPFIAVAAPHRQSLDALAVCHGLPRRLRRALHLLVEYDFGDHFHPAPGTPVRERLFAAVGYYAALPALFSFTPLTPRSNTREALLEVARRIDRGHSVLAFPDRDDLGVVRLAIETGRPLLPVYLESGRAGFGWRFRRPRERLRAHFGAPLTPLPDTAPAAAAAEVASRLDALREAAARA